MKHYSHLSPATQVLLASAGPWGGASAPALGSLRPGDWEMLLLLAQRETATAVLWRQLRGAGVPVPEEYRVRFERLAAIASFHAANVADRLRETLTGFAGAGIPVLLLKGAALAATVYRSFEERPMGDLDLLVAASDAPAARAAALAAGWREAPDMFIEGSYVDHQHLAPIVDGRGTDLSLELHTELLFPGHPFRFDARVVLAEAVRLPDWPGTVLAPSPEHALLHAAVHYAWSHQMQFGVWRTLRDVTALVGSGRLDWDRVVATARASRAASSLYWTLRHARMLAGTEIPSEVLRALAPYRTSVVLEPLARHLELQLMPSDARCPSVQLAKVLWEAALRRGLGSRGDARPDDTPHRVGHPDRMRPTLATRIGRHAGSVGIWGRYLRRVFFPTIGQRRLLAV